MRAVEKIRYRLTGNTNGYMEYQHEGSDVVRWITQGSDISVYALFDKRGEEIVALCPDCKQELGRFNADYGKGTSRKLGAICETAHEHHCQL